MIISLKRITLLPLEWWIWGFFFSLIFQFYPPPSSQIQQPRPNYYTWPPPPPPQNHGNNHQNNSNTPTPLSHGNSTQNHGIMPPPPPHHHNNLQPQPLSHGNMPHAAPGFRQNQFHNPGPGPSFSPHNTGNICNTHLGNTGNPGNSGVPPAKQINIMPPPSRVSPLKTAKKVGRSYVDILGGVVLPLSIVSECIYMIYWWYIWYIFMYIYVR